ncbi:16S rRNA (guanine(527)-N(7))-methyltransferase RsmG [Mycoplasma hafezii]|uniref:16S rRNA (guanine(527)-N(7))-methyltransferase RsmG n=1 Tax=Mycoplasma hafezii TaxID=525886 RepID=UPI003CF11A62
MKYKTIVKNMCLAHNWDFNLFEQYVALIEEKNKVMNLTGFTGDKLWQEGILESLLFMLKITENKDNISILDVGAGCGFPSIPYVLTKPNNKVVIYEPLQKRVNFLNLVIDELNLNEYVTVYNQRVEEMKEKNLFDIITARAVGSVQTMLMSSFHLVKLHGTLSLLKGDKAQEEVSKAADILSKLKINLEIIPFQNKNIERQNNIVVIEKLRSTPKEFPYQWKDIAKVK